MKKTATKIARAAERIEGKRLKRPVGALQKGSGNRRKPGHPTPDKPVAMIGVLPMPEAGKKWVVVQMDADDVNACSRLLQCLHGNRPLRMEGVRKLESVCRQAMRGYIFSS